MPYTDQVILSLHLPASYKPSDLFSRQEGGKEKLIEEKEAKEQESCFIKPVENAQDILAFLQMTTLIKEWHPHEKGQMVSGPEQEQKILTQILDDLENKCPNLQAEIFASHTPQNRSYFCILIHVSTILTVLSNIRKNQKFILTKELKSARCFNPPVEKILNDFFDRKTFKERFDTIETFKKSLLSEVSAEHKDKIVQLIDTLPLTERTVKFNLDIRDEQISKTAKETKNKAYISDSNIRLQNKFIFLKQLKKEVDHINWNNKGRDRSYNWTLVPDGIQSLRTILADFSSTNKTHTLNLFILVMMTLRDKRFPYVGFGKRHPYTEQFYQKCYSNLCIIQAQKNIKRVSKLIIPSQEYWKLHP